MSADTNDADATQRKVLDLVKSLENGEIELPIQELLTPEFVETYSSFINVNEMFIKSGFFIENAADFARIPEKDWDAFIRANTSFATWREMTQAAGLEWAKKRVGG